MIRVDSRGGLVRATYIEDRIDGGETLVEAVGDDLSGALENLVIRFKELQDAALEELRARGFIRRERNQELS